MFSVGVTDDKMDEYVSINNFHPVFPLGVCKLSFFLQKCS